MLNNSEYLINIRKDRSKVINNMTVNNLLFVKQKCPVARHD